MKGRSIRLLFLAVVLGIGAAWLANSWLSDRLALRDVEAAPEWDPVVVAALEIKFGQAIEESNVRLLQLPKGGAPPDSFSKIKDVIGKVATQTILPGEFIVRGRLTGQKGGSTLAAVVAPGKRAVTVRVNDVVGVAGFLLPGNRVDVIASRRLGNRTKSKTLLEDVKVLAVDQTASSDKNEPVIVRALTLELTPEESEQLVQATREGSVQMALRNPLDDHKVAKLQKPPPPPPKPKQIVKKVVVEKPVYRIRKRRSVTLIRGTVVGETKIR